MLISQTFSDLPIYMIIYCYSKIFLKISPKVFPGVEMFPVDVLRLGGEPDVPGARPEHLVQAGARRGGAKAGHHRPVVLVDGLGVRQVGEGHKSNSNGVAL